jgi:hypothetical protein
MIKNNQLILDSINGLCMTIGNTRISVWNNSGRPSSPRQGTIGFNTTSNKIEVYNGSGWVEI